MGPTGMATGLGEGWRGFGWRHSQFKLREGPGQLAALTNEVITGKGCAETLPQSSSWSSNCQRVQRLQADQAGLIVDFCPNRAPQSRNEGTPVSTPLKVQHAPSQQFLPRSRRIFS
jgi:hypothetical protein